MRRNFSYVVYIWTDTENLMKTRKKKGNHSLINLNFN